MQRTNVKTKGRGGIGGGASMQSSGAHVLVRDPEDAAGPLAFLPKIPLNSTLTEFCFELALLHWNIEQY